MFHQCVEIIIQTINLLKPTRSAMCLCVILKMKYIPNVHYNNNVLCDAKVKVPCSLTETIKLCLMDEYFLLLHFLPFNLLKLRKIQNYVPGHIKLV